MPETVQKYSDESRRIADEMTIHAVAKSQGYAIFALADGRPFDHMPYPTWTLAVNATRWDRDRYIYLEIPPDGMHPKEAEACLHYARTLHKMGFRIPPPEDNFDFPVHSMPQFAWDKSAQISHLVKGK